MNEILTALGWLLALIFGIDNHRLRKQLKRLSEENNKLRKIQLAQSKVIHDLNKTTRDAFIELNKTLHAQKVEYEMSAKVNKRFMDLEDELNEADRNLNEFWTPKKEQPNE